MNRVKICLIISSQLLLTSCSIIYKDKDSFLRTSTGRDVAYELITPSGQYIAITSNESKAFETLNHTLRDWIKMLGTTKVAEELLKETPTIIDSFD